jgi:hypothetical protein
MNPYQDNDGNWGVQIAGFDYARFKLLLLSVLWRASVAKGQNYTEVALGRHEERLRKMLREKDPGLQADYPCLIYVFTEPSFGLMEWGPARTRLDGYTSYQFLLPGVLLWFIVGDRTRPHALAKFAPKEDGSLVAPFTRPDQVPLVKQAARTVQKLAALEGPNRPNHSIQPSRKKTAHGEYLRRYTTLSNNVTMS